MATIMYLRVSNVASKANVNSLPFLAPLNSLLPLISTLSSPLSPRLDHPSYLLVDLANLSRFSFDCSDALISR